MKILICISNVPDTTTKIGFVNDNTAFDTNGVQWIINPWDELALTRALELKEASAGVIEKVSVISVGPQSAEPTIRKALAIGADDAFRSFKSGKLIPSVNPNTIADGLLTSLGSITFPIVLKYVHDIVTVSDDNIIKAMRLIWERMKIIVEPSGAVPLGAILQHRERYIGNRIGVILSGGNVDIDKLPWVNG